MEHLERLLEIEAEGRGEGQHLGVHLAGDDGEEVVD
jgi:hypothetical protein